MRVGYTHIHLLLRRCSQVALTTVLDQRPGLVPRLPGSWFTVEPNCALTPQAIPARLAVLQQTAAVLCLPVLVQGNQRSTKQRRSIGKIKALGFP